MGRPGTLAACALSSLGLLACGQLLGLDEFGAASGDNAGAGGSAGTSGASGASSGGAAGNAGTSGGTAGGGGAGGTAGSGGSGQVCSTNSECDDGKACNGVETCEDQRCQPGSAVDCSGIDSTYCVGACVEEATGPKCVLTARDDDGDDHGDSRCEQASGDDCDDGNDKVYTGAPEICDGVDNDCDGKRDVEDGLPLSGAPIEIGTLGWPGLALVAVSPTNIGVMWTDRVGGLEALFFGVFDFAGQPVSVPVRVSEPPTGGGTETFGEGTFSLIWSGSHFLAAWVDSHDGTSTAYVREIGVDGVAGTPPQPVGPANFEAAVLNTAVGFGAVVTRTVASDSVLDAYVVGEAPAPTLERTLSVSGARLLLPRLARAGAAQALVYGESQGGGVSVHFAEVQPLFAVQDPTTLPQSGSAPNLTGLAAGSFGGDFWVSYSTSTSGAGGSVHGWKVGPSGAVVCGPVEVASAADWLFQMGSFAVADSAYNVHLTLDGSTQGAFQLTRIGSDCTVGIAHALTPPDRLVLPYAAVASDSAHHALVWVDASVPPAKLMLRTFGPNLCD